MSKQDSVQIAVVAPTFNNARTLENVLRGIEAYGLAIIVVDDGCTDSTTDILSRWQAEKSTLTRDVVKHPVNQGKAAALLSGFARAEQLGFTHALTFDTDGQLDVADIPALVRMARQNPGALVVGSRDELAADYPAANRTCRRLSNKMVRWESGALVTDSQCGFRVYPLERMRAVRCRTGRYAFETEILTRLAWMGVAIVETTVSCAYDIPEGRVSHFKRWRDPLHATGMHLRLLARSFSPWPIKQVADAPTGTIWRRLISWISPARAWREVRRDPAQRSRFAAGLAVGVFIANLPIYGAQTLLSIYAARKLKLPPLAVIVGSHLSTPPIGPILILIGIATGHLLTHGSQQPFLFSIDSSNLGYAQLMRTWLVEWIVGGVVCGAALAGLTFVLTQSILRRLPPYTPAASEADPAAEPSDPDRAEAESAV